MKLSILVIIVVVTYVMGERTHYNGYKVYEIIPRNANDLNVLKWLRNDKILDFWQDSNLINHDAKVMIHEDAENVLVLILQQNHMEYKIIIDDVEKIFEKEKIQQEIALKRSNGKITFTAYHRHEEINDYLDELAVEYPSLVSVKEMGSSFEGRKMKTITISSGGNGTKPVIFVDAAIHAREWATPAFALYIINQLVENYDKNTEFLDDIDWIILPVVNPDGYEYSHTNTRLWRKTRSITADPKCFGVDGNRNYDYKWMGPGGNNRICDETYSGPRAFSEKETQIVRDILWENKDRIKLYLSIHTYGNYLLTPWAYTTDLPYNYKDLKDLGESVSDAIKAATGSSYKTGSTVQLLYYAAGVSNDYAAGAVGINISYTWELPGGGSAGFDLPPSRILEVVEETFIGLRVFAEYIQRHF